MDCWEIRIPRSLQLGRGWKRILVLSLLALFSQSFCFHFTHLVIRPFSEDSHFTRLHICPFHRSHLFIGHLFNKKLLSPFELSCHHPLGQFHSISTTWDMSHGLLYWYFLRGHKKDVLALGCLL